MANKALLTAFGDRIRQLRHRKNLSQEQLAELTGFHRTYIGMVANGSIIRAVDRLSKEKRSWLMSRVGSKNTTPELIVRSLVHRLGFRYRLHYQKLPGKPDLAFPRSRKVIFVHGCFWHGHRGCPKARLPKSNTEYWDEKIARNRERDRLVQRAVRQKSWSVLVVWQCEIRKGVKIETRLRRFLSKR